MPARAALFCAAALAALAVPAWLMWPGSPAPVAASGPAMAVAPPDLPDPAAAGNYTVGYLTYGSGDDRQRPEYGRNVTLPAPTVDAIRV